MNHFIGLWLSQDDNEVVTGAIVMEEFLVIVPKSGSGNGFEVSRVVLAYENLLERTY